MKQPVKISVCRAHGNSGDVVTTITGADGDVQRISVPGEGAPYTSVAAMREHLEALFNATEPGDPSPPELATPEAPAEEEEIPPTQPGPPPDPTPVAEVAEAAPLEPKRRTTRRGATS